MFRHRRIGDTLEGVLGWLQVLPPLIASTPTSGIRFDHLSTGGGLSQDIVWDIVQDSLGFIWIGTENGLNRYDGHDVRVFKHRAGDSTTIPSNWCGALAVDGTGDVWVGTPSGLARYNQRKGRFEPVAAFGRAGRYIVDLAVDERGSVWVSTGDTVFAGVDTPGGPQAIPFPHVARGQGALLSPSRSGGMLVCGGKGLYRAQRETGRLDAVTVPLRGALVRAVHEDTDGTLWVAFVDAGVGRLEQEVQIQGVLGFRIRENIEERSRYGEISAIAIKPKARKLGIGRLLMEFAENRARELGCKGTWLVSGFGREETAHQFYTKLGYQITGYRFVKPVNQNGDTYETSEL